MRAWISLSYQTASLCAVEAKHRLRRWPGRGGDVTIVDGLKSVLQYAGTLPLDAEHHVRP